MFVTWFLAALASPLVTAYLVAPPGTPYPEASSDCSAWVEYTTGLTCATVEETYSITEADFESWNPLVASTGSCTLASGFCYCVQVNFISTSSTSSSSSVVTTTVVSTSSAVSTTTSSTSSTTTTSGNGIATPSPIQANMTSNCDSFYLVSSGDTCDTIATAEGITVADIESWNPAVGSDCTALWVDDYICIGIIGGSTTTSASATSATATGTATPSPVQTGIASDCDAFYLVQSGDTCQTIATAEGISLSDFYTWNPAVGSSCTTLIAGDYVCVSIVGFTTTTTSIAATTTSSGNGIPTPSPIQSGMVTDCDQFHLVSSGDTCATIASAADISVSDFYTWNPTVGSDCSSLWLGYYVCIDIIGYTPSTTTATTLTTTTSAGNGISTPTPIQSGMVSDCNKFFLVGSGDTCATIASSEGVTVAELESWNSGVGSSCSSLWLGYYICVGIL